MKDWARSAWIYFEPRMLGIFFLGFSSGLPFLLTLATLHIWLTEAGFDKTTLGLFVLCTLPYSLKFLWAPLIDKIHLPVFTDLFGPRKGWILFSQLLLILSLLFLGGSDPQHHPGRAAFFATLVAFASASQDIVIEAYRIESLKGYQLGYGAGASVLGYRMGMWVSGAGALYLASYFSWQLAYGFMAACVMVGVIATLLSQEPPLPEPEKHQTSGEFLPLQERLLSAIKEPVRSLGARQDWAIILLFIFLYKVGDTVLNTMTVRFLLEMGFSKIEIAHVAKSFGISAMVLGGFMGGILLSRKQLVYSLLLCGILQISACLMFALQSKAGHNLGVLFLSIGVENLACGLGSATFIAYLTNLCRLPFTATHFALLTSIGSFARVSLSSVAGWIADQMTWTQFYLGTALACLPCILLLFAQASKFTYARSVREA